MSLRPLWLALVALVPAGATWWTGRRVLRRIDDPALPELLMRRRGRMGMLWMIWIGVIVSLDQRHAAWTIPLMLGAMVAAAFPAQRVLLDERWGIGAYLWHTTLRFVGGLAFWVVLVLAPSIVMGTRDSRLAALLAAALAATLLLWLHQYRRVWLWTHGATPLGPRPLLDARFAAVIERATTTQPLLFRYGQPGERRAAAFAFPSAGQPGAVIFSDALLELLTPEETAAVFAHEVAHLEHFTPQRIRRMQVGTSLLVVALLAVSLVAQRSAPGLHLAYTLGGAFVVLVALGVRASRSRGHETASDLRGADLCGDAEALVRALTKLHAALRLPRRWSGDAERTATHPSLVHRIAALRAAVAATPESAGDGAGQTAPSAPTFAPVLLPSSRPGSCVVMEATRIHILDGVPADLVARGEADVAALAARAADVRTLAYERLTRLALEGDGRRETRLVVVERGGGRWSVPLAPGDAERARVALDVVDVRVGTAAPSGATRGRALAAIVVCAAAVVLLAAGQLGVLALLAAGALFLPGAATLGAFAAAAIARSAIALAAAGASGAPFTLLALAAALGVVGLVLAWREARPASEGAPADPRSRRSALTALALLTTLYGATALWVAATLAPLKAVPLLHAFAALAAGLAAATALWPRSDRRRWLAAPVAAAALAAPLVAARLDPGTMAGQLVRRDAEARVVSSAGLPGLARDIVVAPTGARYVVRVFDPYDDEDYDDEGDDADAPVARMHLALGVLGDSGAPAPVAIDGRAATFAGDDSLLVLASRRGEGVARTLELRLSAIAGDSIAAPSWSVALPALLAPELRLDGAARRWSVTGRAADASRAIVMLEGRLGDTTVVRRVRAVPAREPGGGVAAVTPLAGGWALEARLRGDYRTTMALGVFGVSPWTTELSLFDGTSARQIAELPGFARCVGGGATRAAACALTEPGGTSRLAVVDSSGRVETLATLAGPMTTLAMGRDGRVAVAIVGGQHVVVLDPARRTALHLTLPADLSTPTDVQWTDGGDIVIVGYSERGTKIVRVR